MDEPASLLLPAGVTMRIRGNRLALAQDGSIRIEGDLGVPLHTIVSRRGDVELPGTEGMARVGAAGTLTVHGDLVAAHVQADRLVVEGTIRAREIRVGAGGIQVGGGLFAVSLATTGDVQVEGLTRAETFQVGGSMVAAELRSDLVEVQGDLEILDALATPRLRVGGRLVARGNTQAADIVVQGNATFSGRVHADEVLVRGLASFESDVVSKRVRAGVVRLLGKMSNVRGVQGADEVHVGPGRVQSDALIAPAIHFDPGTSGRVTLVESRNELGPSSVKGCLGLADLDEMFGGAESFLEERGLVSLRADADPLQGTEEEESDLYLDDEVSEYDLYGDEDSDGSAPASLPEGQAPAAGAARSGTEPGPGAPEADLAAPDASEEETVAEPSVPASAVGVASHQPEPAAVELEDEDEDEDEPAEAEDDDEPLEAVVLEEQTPEAPLPGPPAVAVAAAPGPRAFARGDVEDFGGSFDEDPDGGTDLHGRVEASLADESPSAELPIEAVSAGTQAVAPPDEAGEDAVGGAVGEVGTDEASAGTEDDIPTEAETIDQELLEPVSDSVVEDETYLQMRDIAGRISSCYKPGDEPPAITRLHTLIESRDYGTIRSDLTDIWKDLLKFHQRRGMRIQPQVTTTFNQINSMVRKLTA